MTLMNWPQLSLPILIKEEERVQFKRLSFVATQNVIKAIEGTFKLALTIHLFSGNDWKRS